MDIDGGAESASALAARINSTSPADLALAGAAPQLSVSGQNGGAKRANVIFVANTEIPPQHKKQAKYHERCSGGASQKREVRNSHENSTRHAGRA